MCEGMKRNLRGVAGNNNILQNQPKWGITKAKCKQQQGTDG